MWAEDWISLYVIGHEDASESPSSTDALDVDEEEAES